MLTGSKPSGGLATSLPDRTRSSADDLFSLQLGGAALVDRGPTEVFTSSVGPEGVRGHDGDSARSDLLLRDGSGKMTRIAEME